jgi:hypothetical protein
MVKSKVSEWDPVAANNGDIGGITLDGAVMTPSLVDNAQREQMAQVATQLGDIGAKGADIASASTTNLANATGWYLDITGTTTITSFGTVADGQQYTLRFTGILTLTHNATSLILPGAANITTAAGDIAVMMSLGSGNWRCIDYQRASGLAGDVTQTGAQTLSNKTLASPAFTGTPTGLDASTTAKGIVEKATSAEVYAATADKYIAADNIEAASALVALTDAATVAVDWDAGINFSLTVTANRAVGNPTNGQPGTYRTILVQGNDATDRTVTFGNQFLGDVPTITDCDSTKWYLLTIRCVTATHFVVVSQVANKP